VIDVLSDLLSCAACPNIRVNYRPMWGSNRATGPADLGTPICWIGAAGEVNQVASTVNGIVLTHSKHRIQRLPPPSEPWRRLPFRRCRRSNQALETLRPTSGYASSTKLFITESLSSGANLTGNKSAMMARSQQEGNSALWIIPEAVASVKGYGGAVKTCSGGDGDRAGGLSFRAAKKRKISVNHSLESQ
jgi:hypothetical protein